MATQNVAGSVNLLMSFQEIISSGLLTSLNLPANVTQQLTFTNATTGALTVDQIHAKVYTLAATPTTIDLTSLLDLNGNTMNFARVRMFFVYNPHTTAANVVTVYKGASNGWSYLPASTGPLTAVAKGGFILLADPSNSLSTNGMVTSGSSKTITFDPGANTVDLSVLIAGGSAT